MEDFYEDYQEIIDFQIAYTNNPDNESLKKQCIQQIEDLFVVYTGLEEENKLQRQTCQLEKKYWEKDQLKIERKQAIIKVISKYLVPEAIDNLLILEEYHKINQRYLNLVLQTNEQVVYERSQLMKLKQFIKQNRNNSLNPTTFCLLTETIFTIEMNQILRGKRITRQAHQINAIYDGISTSFSPITSEETEKGYKVQENIAILTNCTKKTCSKEKNMIK